MSCAFILEMVRDQQRAPLQPGELRVYQDVVVFEDAMQIKHRHRQRPDVWWCRPERFPWVVVALGHFTIHTSGYFPMPAGTRIRAKVIWRPTQPPYCVSVTGPTEFQQPLRPPRLVHL